MSDLREATGPAVPPSAAAEAAGRLSAGGRRRFRLQGGAVWGIAAGLFLLAEVILAVGARPVDGLSEQVKNRVAEIYVIGDAKRPRRALDAIHEAFEIARQV